jgi:hypothetical protein
VYFKFIHFSHSTLLLIKYKGPSAVLGAESALALGALRTTEEADNETSAKNTNV